MKRIIFPLAFIVGIAAAALSGVHSVAHPLAITHIAAVQSSITHIA